MTYKNPNYKAEYMRIYRKKNPGYVIKQRDLRIAWGLRNKDHIRTENKRWLNSHKSENIIRCKKYRGIHKEEMKRYNDLNKGKKAAWVRRNKEKLNSRRQERLKTNIQFRLSISLRNRLRAAIKNGYKSGSAVRDLGCTIPELKFYLEGQFQDGMTWENWTIDGWHIDHKIPLFLYNLEDREQFLQACHYTNLQPMWAEENLRKNKYLNSDNIIL